MGYLSKSRSARIFDPNEWGTTLECLYCQSSTMFFEYLSKGRVTLICDRCGAEGPQNTTGREADCINEHKMAHDMRMPTPDALPNTEPRNPTLGTNLRVNRARSFASKLIQDMPEEVPESLHEEIYRSILDSLTRNGVCWTNDEERAAFGLEPRDQLGWSPSETAKVREQMKPKPTPKIRGLSGNRPTLVVMDDLIA